MRNVSLTATICGMVAGLLIVACAAQQPLEGEKTTIIQPPPSPTPELDEIGERYGEIREWRRELGLSSDPSPADRNQWRYIHLSKALDFCPEEAEPQTPTCQDVCSIADHICENAEEICRIAGDLGDHLWAQEKCSSAKASCKDGKKRCCDCNGNGHELGDPDASELPEENED